MSYPSFVFAVCLGLGFGCGAPRPALPGPAPTATAATPRPAASAAATSAAKPPETPSLELTARAVEAEPFGLCTGNVRPLPLRGVEIYQSDLPSSGDNVVAYAKRAPNAKDHENVLLDAASGRRLAVVGDVYTGEARLKRAIVSPTGSDVQELLDLENGSRVRPRVTTPEGAAIEWRIGLDGRRGLVWFVARSKNGRAFFGVWPEPRSEPVLLAQALPFWPKSLSEGSGVLVSDGEQSCLLAGTGAQCLPGQHTLEPLLEGRYLALDAGIYDIAQQQEMQLDEDCDFRSVASLEEPPRVLFRCEKPEQDEVRWLVWSPEGILARWTSGHWLAPQMCCYHGTRVVPLELLVRPDAIVNHWFDLLLGRVVVTPPLVTLRPQRGFGARIVVETDEEHGPLLLLDVEAGTLTTLVPSIDCESPLIWQEGSDQRGLVACPKPSMDGNYFRPASRPYHYEWLELLDFRTRRRLRTNQVFEATLTETGIPVGFQPGPVWNLAAVDWPASCPGD